MKSRINLLSLLLPFLLMVLVSSTAYAQNRVKVSGAVTNTAGDFISGVSVTVKDTKQETVTNSNGVYSINVDKERILLFNHVGYHTFAQGITEATTLNATHADAVSNKERVMNALTNPKLNEYWHVKNAIIENNTIVQCENAIVVSAGKSDTRVLTPDSLAIINNYVLIRAKLLILEDEPTRFIVQGNQVRGATLIPGFTTMATEMLRRDANGIWQLKGNNKTPFWFTSIVGPDWKEKKPDFKIL